MAQVIVRVTLRPDLPTTDRETGRRYLEREGACVECPRCGQCFGSVGGSPSSLARLGVLLSQSCPLGERNFYVTSDPNGSEGRR